MTTPYYMRRRFVAGAIGAGMDIDSIVDDEGNVVDLATQAELDDHTSDTSIHGGGGGGGGLDQSQVDARVAHGVADWAEAGDSSDIPDEKIPSGVLRTGGVQSWAKTGSSIPLVPEGRIDHSITRDSEVENWAKTRNSTLIPDNKIPSAIARDSEIPDPSSANPTTVGGTRGPGSGTDYSRANHDHAIPARTDTNPTTIGDARTVGSEHHWARGDHGHGIPGFYDQTPERSTTSAGSFGSSSLVARGDHRHQASAGGGSGGAANFLDLDDTPDSFGTAGQVPAINNDTDELEFVTPLQLASTTPTSIGTAAVGDGSTAARDNHVHGADLSALVTEGAIGLQQSSVHNLTPIQDSNRHRVTFNQPTVPLDQIQYFEIEVWVRQRSGAEGSVSHGRETERFHRPSGGWGTEAEVENRFRIEVTARHHDGSGSATYGHQDVFVSLTYSDTLGGAGSLVAQANGFTATNREIRVNVFAYHYGVHRALPTPTSQTVGYVAKVNTTGSGYVLAEEADLSDIVAGGSGSAWVMVNTDAVHLNGTDAVTLSITRPANLDLDDIQYFLIEARMAQISGTAGTHATGFASQILPRPTGGWVNNDPPPVFMSIMARRTSEATLDVASSETTAQFDLLVDFDFPSSSSATTIGGSAQVISSWSNSHGRQQIQLKLIAIVGDTNRILPELAAAGADANKILVVTSDGDGYQLEYPSDSPQIRHMAEVTRQLRVQADNPRAEVTGGTPDAQIALIDAGDELEEDEIDNGHYHNPRIGPETRSRFLVLRVRESTNLTADDFQVGFSNGADEFHTAHGSHFHKWDEATDDTTWHYYVYGPGSHQGTEINFDRPTVVILYRNGTPGGTDILFDGEPTQVEDWALKGKTDTVPFTKTGLPDPSSATDNQVATVSGGVWTIANAASGGGGGSTTFLALTDVDETTFTGNANNIVMVSADADDIAFGGSLSDTAPGNTPGSASAGTGTDFSRSDHDHGVSAPAAAPGPTVYATALNTRGSGYSASDGDLFVWGGGRGSNSAGWLSQSEPRPALGTPGDSNTYNTSAVTKHAIPIGIVDEDIAHNAVGRVLTKGVKGKVLGDGGTWGNDTLVYISRDPEPSSNSANARFRVYHYTDQPARDGSYLVGQVIQVRTTSSPTTSVIDVAWDFHGRELVYPRGVLEETIGPILPDLWKEQDVDEGVASVPNPTGISLVTETGDDPTYVNQAFTRARRVGNGTVRRVVIRLPRGENPAGYVVDRENTSGTSLERFYGWQFQYDPIDATDSVGGTPTDVSFYTLGSIDEPILVRPSSSEYFDLKNITTTEHTSYHGRVVMPPVRTGTTPYTGELRRNSTNTGLEMWDGDSWESVSPVQSMQGLTEARTVRRAYYQLATSAPSVPTNLTYDPATDLFGGVGNWVSDPPTPDSSVTGQERWGVILEANRPQGGTFTVRGSLPAHRWQDTRDGLGAQYSANGTSGWSNTLSSGLRNYVRFWNSATQSWGDSVPLRDTILPTVVANIGGPSGTEGGVLNIDTSFRPADYSYFAFRISRTTQSQGQGDVRWTELGWVSASDLFDMSEEFTAPTGDAAAMTNTLRAKKGLVVSYASDGYARVAAVEAYHSSSAARGGGDYQHVYITPRRTGNTVVDMWVHSATQRNRPFRIIMEGTR